MNRWSNPRSRYIIVETQNPAYYLPIYHCAQLKTDELGELLRYGSPRAAVVVRIVRLPCAFPMPRISSKLISF